LREICDEAIRKVLEPERKEALFAGFQELERIENFLNFLLSYKVSSLCPKS
jgi:hypothetical protein